MNRIFSGFVSGVVGNCASLCIRCHIRRETHRGMGLLGASFGIGFTIGPGLGIGVVAIWGELFVCGVGIGLFSLAGFAVAWFFVAEPQRDKAKVQQKLNLFVLIKNHDIARICGLYFCIYLMFTAMEHLCPLGFDAVWLNRPRTWVVFGFGWGNQCDYPRGIIGALSKEFGEARLVTYGVVVMFWAMVSMLVVQEKWQILLPMGLFSCAMGLVIPAVQSLLTRLADADIKGTVTGAGQSMASLARILGPIWGGVAFSYGVSLPYSIASLL